MLNNMEMKTVNAQQIEISLVGELYVEEATELRERLLKEVEKGVCQMVMDVSGLRYIDSSGLGVLIAIHKRCVKKNGAVKIKGLQGDVKELFELTRLNKVFEII